MRAGEEGISCDLKRRSCGRGRTDLFVCHVLRPRLSVVLIARSPCRRVSWQKERFEKRVSGGKSKNLYEVAERDVRDIEMLGRCVKTSLLIATYGTRE